MDQKSAFLIIKNSGQALVINQIGGGIVSYKAGGKDLIIPYENCPGDKVGMMGDVLFPFPGRVKNSQYIFNGEKYCLNGTFKKDGHSIHGFVTDKKWEIEERKDHWVRLSYQIKKEEYEKNGYPFSLKIQIKYSLSDKGLKVESEITNTGEEKAPFGLGFHPYFTAGANKVDDIYLKINAKKLIEFDDDLFPTGKMVELKGQDLDYNCEKQIKDKVIDNCFTDLIWEEGICKTKISSSVGKNIVWQDEGFDYLQMYSADTIGEKFMRSGLAIEPQTCTGFAFNKHEMGLKTLEAGNIYRATWGVDI